MNISHTLLLGSLLVSCSALAGWVDMEGHSLPDTEFRKAIGDFGAQLVLTDKEEETFTKWNTPSSVVNIATTKKINKGKFLTAAIIFFGCGADKSGNCELLVKFKILQPDGSTYADLPPQEAWVNKPAPPNKSLQMSVGYIRVRIEPNEPLGKYTITAEVIDKILGKSLTVSDNFEAIE